MSDRHEYGDSFTAMLCGAMVTDDEGYGKQCGLPASDPIHEIEEGAGVVTLHVVPARDLIPHDAESDDYICKPIMNPVPRADGSYGWLAIHHSLDGREVEA